MSRLPGKKYRDEMFRVNGRAVYAEVRLTDRGRFLCLFDGNSYEDPTLDGLREKLRPVLEAFHQLQYAPAILIRCHDAEDDTSRWHRGRESEDVEVTLGFEAGWKSTTPVDRGGRGNREMFRWVPVDAKPDAIELPRPDLERRDHGDTIDDGDSVVPFTPARWSALHQMRDALATIRRRIATVMGDQTGALLDATTGPAMLAPPSADEAPTPKRRTRR